ncbi:hypothetical protein A3Q56_04433 [Intoshia linei]|uniref:Dynein light intermediate chain n=1 Tax=Intoshia linei TaxID=1819745 RepID=A0A177B344_9BILA|nr:hypothetical protein A3Q56_04433 [Intoshia linei]
MLNFEQFIVKDSEWSKIIDKYRKKDVIDNVCNIILIGKRFSGKKTILNRFNCSRHSDYNFLMDYSYIDDDGAKLNFYSLHYGPHLKSMMNQCLSTKNGCHSIILPIVPLSQPWLIMDEIKEIIDCVNFYVTEESKSQQFNEMLKNNHLGYLYYCILDLSVFLVTTALYNTKKMFESDATFSGPLTMESRCSIPIIVCITKCDEMDKVEKMYDNDLIIEYIQKNIRELCLKYSTGVIFLSPKTSNSTNCDLLLKYLKRLAGFIKEDEYKISANFYEKDGLFIPFAWDNLENIKICNDQISQYIDLNSNYNEIVSVKNEKSVEQDNIIVDLAHENNQFLKSIKRILQENKHDVSERKVEKETLTGTVHAYEEAKLSSENNSDEPLSVSNDGTLSSFFQSLLFKNGKKQTENVYFWNRFRIRNYIQFPIDKVACIKMEPIPINSYTITACMGSDSIVSGKHVFKIEMSDIKGIKSNQKKISIGFGSFNSIINDKKECKLAGDGIECQTKKINIYLLIEINKDEISFGVNNVYLNNVFENQLSIMNSKKSIESNIIENLPVYLQFSLLSKNGNFQCSMSIHHYSN